MAGAIRLGCLRITIRPTGLLNNYQNSLPSALTQKCNIAGKSMLGENRPQKPPPYPYKTKKYGVLQAIFEKTSKRMDQNSKIICVDGPIGVGKSQFAIQLAEELEMLHMPAANMDMTYINQYGYDLRKLDPQLPKSCRSFDHKNFCRDPNHPLAAQFQIRMYMNRYLQYVDALAHLFSTGQGVVLERSVFSDFVFLEAMHNQGFISKGARSVYHEIKENSIHELLRPHLVIYLDCPPAVVKNRIAERNLDYEKDSKVFSDKYLNDMEQVYKQQYLKSIVVHSELLVYDWSNRGDIEVVVEDIERVDFDNYSIDPLEKKMADWRFHLEWDWCEQRIKFCNEKDVLQNYFNVPRFDVPELMRDGEDSKKWRDVWFDAPGNKYRRGYNEDMGDTGILTKIKLELRNNY